VVGQPLEPYFPYAGATAVAAAAVGRDQELVGPGIQPLAHLFPPPTRRRRRELSRIMVDAHTHPARITGQVVDPVGDHLAQLLVQEVLGANPLRLPGGLPLPAAVLEIPDQ